MVTLTPREIQHALLEGGIRQAEAMANNWRDQFQPPTETDAWLNHINGAACEIAVAKYLHAYWSGCSGFRAPDVYGFEVRTSNGDCLAIRPKDADSDRFVFVTGRIPTFAIHGWIFGYEARQVGKLSDPGSRNCPAYFVPIAALHPLEEVMLIAEPLDTF